MKFNHDVLIWFQILPFNQSPLHIAVIEENVEIVQLLAMNSQIDINAKSV